jgi:hypothetical protein
MAMPDVNLPVQAGRPRLRPSEKRSHRPCSTGQNGVLKQ